MKAYSPGRWLALCISVERLQEPGYKKINEVWIFFTLQMGKMEGNGALNFSA